MQTATQCSLKTKVVNWKFLHAYLEQRVIEDQGKILGVHSKSIISYMIVMCARPKTVIVTSQALTE